MPGWGGYGPGMNNTKEPAAATEATTASGAAAQTQTAAASSPAGRALKREVGGRNERLAGFIENTGLSKRGFAKVSGVSKDTVTGLLDDANKMPREGTVKAIGDAWNLSEAERMDLFPALDHKPRPAGQTRFTGWQAVADVSAEQWRKLLDNAAERVWLCDYAPTALLAAYKDKDGDEAGLARHLATLHGGGVDVRVLIADDGAQEITDRDRTADPLDRIGPRAEAARHALRPLRGLGAFKLHGRAIPAAMLLVDDTCWFIPAIYAAPTRHWPVIVTNTAAAENLVKRHQDAFTRLWNAGTPL